MSAAPESSPAADPAPPPLRALLVDDVAMNRRVAELFLKHLGCTVVGADGVAAALTHLRAEAFDLVLTDVEMPDINGLKAVALFRAADAEAHPGRARPLKLLAVSAGQIGMTHEDYLAAGFDEHLAKPVELERLRAILERWRAQDR
jgi:CheY-like chemotaxis protein